MNVTCFLLSQDDFRNFGLRDQKPCDHPSSRILQENKICWTVLVFYEVSIFEQLSIKDMRFSRLKKVICRIEKQPNLFAPIMNKQWIPGLNFINVLCTAFMHADPKSVKSYCRCNCILKLTPGCSRDECPKQI